MAKKILMIDDEPNTIKIIEDRLKLMGYDFEGRMNPKDGQWATSKTRPDLIIIDVSMPGWSNGVDFLVSLKHNPALTGVPIVVYTSLNDPDLQRRAAESGAAGYFQKVSGNKALFDKIKSLLG